MKWFLTLFFLASIAHAGTQNSSLSPKMSLTKITKNTSLSEALNFLQNQPYVESITPLDGDIDYSCYEEECIIYVATFKESDDAVLITFFKKDNEFAISDLILYKNWKQDSSLPKKKRKQKTEIIDSIPFR